MCDTNSIITFPIFQKHFVSLSPLLNRHQALPPRQSRSLRRQRVAPSFQSPSLLSQLAFCPHQLTVSATAPPASGPAGCWSSLWWTHALLLHTHSKQSLCQADVEKKKKKGSTVDRISLQDQTLVLLIIQGTRVPHLLSALHISLQSDSKWSEHCGKSYTDSCWTEKVININFKSFWGRGFRARRFHWSSQKPWEDLPQHYNMSSQQLTLRHNWKNIPLPSTHLKCTQPLLPLRTAWLRWPRLTQSVCTRLVSRWPVRWEENNGTPFRFPRSPKRSNVTICWRICGLQIHTHPYVFLANTNLWTLSNDHLPNCVLLCRGQVSKGVQVPSLKGNECVDSLSESKEKKTVRHYLLPELQPPPKNDTYSRTEE